MTNLKKRLKSVMSVQTTTYDTRLMNHFIVGEAKNIPNTKVVKKDGNIYITRGNADVYPCVVAHTDTVHDIEKEFHVLECGGVLLAVNEKYKRVGIGGDDKVGVFVALEALRSIENIKVAFFRDEEIGCHGSRVADMKFFKDVAFVLQCDRKGYDDFVNDIYNTKLYSEEFSEAIQELLYKYGRVESDGGLTDVLQLVDNGLEVCVANMSCGYYDPHTENEFIIMKEVFATLDFVKELCNDLGDTVWEIKAEDRDNYKHANKYNYGQGGYSYNDYAEEYREEWWGKPIKKGSFDSWGTKEKNKKEEDTGYLVSGATCCKCNGHEKVHYDEFVDMYYCFGCDDYVLDEDIEFDDVEQDQSFLAYIEDRQKLIEDKGYDETKEI